MTVSAQTLAFEYTANGVTTTFPYQCRILFVEQLKVYVNGVIQVGGYSLTNVGNQMGGDVVFSVAPADGATVLIRRISDRVRTTDFQQAPYFTQEELLDLDQDYQTMLLQEAAAEGDKSIKIPAEETNIVLLPNAATRADKAIAFDENGDVVVFDLTTRFDAEVQRATAEANRAENEADRSESEANEAQIAANLALAAVSGSVNTFFAATKAAADTLAAGLGDGATVITDRDETAGGVQTRRVVTGGVLGAPVNELDAGQVKDAAQTTSGITVTVGAGGDFSTINAALAALSRYYPLYVNEGITATINLLTGFVMDEQVIVVNGVDLSWIKITSVDASVTAARSALTRAVNNVAGLGALTNFRGFFMAGGNSSLPRIGCTFSMDTSGTERLENVGMLVSRGASGIIEPGFGFNDTDGDGVVVVFGGQLTADNTVWRRNGRSKPSNPSADIAAIAGRWQGIISAVNANIQDSYDCGMVLIGGTVSSVRGAVIQNNARHGILSGSVSLVHARAVNIQNNGGSGIEAAEGSLVRLIQSTIDNNTGNGIRISECSIVNSATGTSISNNGGSGVRIQSGGRFTITTPTINGNAINGINLESGEAFVTGGSIANNVTRDLNVSAGSILRGLVGTTTTGGNSAAANVADSNQSAFNVHSTSATGGGIFGRGGRSANRGTATITSSNTSIVVTHGVDFTPLISEISVTPTNALGVANKFWVSNVTTTQFTINVDAAPGAGGATFGWHCTRIIG